jgi:GntR family transcriptional repressor for pyruvate dehydrogenase complex
LIDAMRTTATAQEFYGLDTDFHLELSRVSGNRLAPVLMEALREAMGREMLRGFAVLPDFERTRDRLVAEHTRVVEAVESGDRDAAATAVRDHIERFYREVSTGPGAQNTGRSV